MATEVSVSRDIGAPAERVFSMVSDLPRMGEWSPENRGGRWKGGAIGAAVGARFSGGNKRGIHRWSTTATVTDMDAPEVFSFDVTFMGIPAANWRYEIESTDDGCRVTEIWTDQRAPWFAVMGTLGTGVADRETHNRSTMQATLDSLAGAAERAASGS